MSGGASLSGAYAYLETCIAPWQAFVAICFYVPLVPVYQPLVPNTRFVSRTDMGGGEPEVAADVEYVAFFFF